MSLILGGCAGVTVTHHVNLDYSQGDSLFVKQKALEGILERVVIKTVHIGELRTSATVRLFGRDLCPSDETERAVVYEDTLRGLWNTDQLISHTEAIDLAIIALEILLAKVIEHHCA